MNASAEMSTNVLQLLAQVLGADNVVTAPDELAFYASDVYTQGATPEAVVRPSSTEEVAEVVKLAAEHNLVLVPRGGGASYTDGYLARAESKSLLLDTARLDRILEIDEQNMFVVVQAGVTWNALNEALKPLGLRTPFYGPFSGLHATVGGSISQHSVSWGSGTFGVSADSVLGVEVVLGLGSVLRTGSWGTEGNKAFFRHYGPDLTGLFTGDAGAMGVKTAIALRLIKRPPEFIGLSFKFQDFDTMLLAMTAAAKLGVSTLNFGLDPTLQQGQLGKAGSSEAIAAALAVFRSSRNPLDGLLQVSRMAIAGKRFLAGASYSCHFIVEGLDRPACKSSAAALRQAVIGLGVETASTIPTVVQAMPFAPFHNLLGPKGERWVPLHGVFPFSDVLPFRRALEQLYARYASRMEQHGVVYGGMFTTIETNAFLYEPVFYWPDERNACLERMVPQDYLEQLPTYEANPQGRALVAEMKQAIVDLMHEHGAIHFQIGKVYPYLRDRNETAEKLVRALKNSVDPRQAMNPGALGLE